jgi:hypothetical protein
MEELAEREAERAERLARKNGREAAEREVSQLFRERQGDAPSDSPSSQDRGSSPLLTAKEHEQFRRQLHQVLNDPSLPQILSAYTLNTLLRNIQALQGRGIVGSVVLLEEKTLELIHVSGSGGGSVAAIQSKRIKWPLEMLDEPYDADRGKFQELTDTAKQQLASDDLQRATIRDMQAVLDQMYSTHCRLANDMKLSDIISVRRCLEELDDCVHALSSPQAVNYFNRRWAPKGRDVAELVYHMTREGLRFAPALKGDEAAYQALRRALISYCYGLDQQLRRTP